MSNGYLLYDGPSLLDGKRIIVIAVGFAASSRNIKTGGLIQTYILLADTPPQEAVNSGADSSICGDCVHRGVPNERGRSCYVQVGQGPTSVYKAYQRGNYGPINDAELGWRLFKDRRVRFGTYGDPAAVPLWVWTKIMQYAESNTGYTHQWKTCSPLYAQWCMASVETEEEAAEARAKGYRTFRIQFDDAPRTKLEAACPASKEAGMKLQCYECMMCGGRSTRARGHIAIRIHGNSAHRSNARKLVATLSETC